MEKARPSIACWVYGLFFLAALIPSALASTDYSYVFTANPGQVTWYNGTTIEIQVTPGLPDESPPPDLFFNVVSLVFHGDVDLGAYGDIPASLTPFSFSVPPSGGLDVVGIAYANQFGWQGGISGYGGPGISGFSGAYFMSSTTVAWGPDSGGGPQPIIIEPATGTWSLVPDGGGSFELLAAALAALGAGRRLMGRARN
jgi:hypothetical protein